MKTFDSRLLIKASPLETYPRNCIAELITTETVTLNNKTKPSVNTTA
jgi:hypothetical protein